MPYDSGIVFCARPEAYRGATWAGRKAIRISVSNWQTTETDVERTVEAFRAVIAAPAAAR